MMEAVFLVIPEGLRRMARKPSKARQGRLATARSEPVPGLIGERARADPQVKRAR